MHKLQWNQVGGIFTTDFAFRLYWKDNDTNNKLNLNLKLKYWSNGMKIVTGLKILL